MNIRLVKKRLARMTRHPEVLAIAAAIAQTNTSTGSSVDLGPMVGIISAVIPLFVLVAVIKILFKSFKDVA